MPRCSYHTGRGSCGPTHVNACDTARATFNVDDWLGLDPAGHLFDGLAYLLRAAQEWQMQEELNLVADGYLANVYAMDSVFLRARLLFEFFTGQGENYCHARCLFGLPAQLAGPPNFRQWKNELHIGAMHLQDRSTGGQLTEYGGTGLKDLNQMPVDIARGVLDVWHGFEAQLVATHQTALLNKAEKCREQAEEDSRRVVDHVSQRVEAYKNANTSSLTVLF